MRVKAKRAFAAPPGAPDEPPPPFGAKEWKRARFAEREGFQRLKEARDLIPFAGVTTAEQKRAIGRLRVLAFTALTRAKKLRFAAYMEGYVPRQQNRGVKYDEDGAPVEGSKSEFEKWWERLTPADQALVEERRERYRQVAEDDGWKVVWKVRGPRKKVRPREKNVFRAPGWNLGPA